jgi:hypothetical protein
MECPRCGLFNPPEAQRCDCGYDFAKGTVERAYFRQALPKQMKTSLLVIILLNLVALITVALAAGDLVRILVAICWAGLMWFLYGMVFLKHYWAYIALIVITFPIGLVLANTREVRLYCLQK